MATTAPCDLCSVAPAVGFIPDTGTGTYTYTHQQSKTNRVYELSKNFQYCLMAE